MVKISFLASHGGSAAKYIINSIRAGKIDAEIGVVIVNNADSEIHRWCKQNSVDAAYVSGKTHPSDMEKDGAIRETLVSVKTDLIILSGYMKKIGPATLSEFTNKILNIHPSLLPRHGGKGMFGDRVHESVLKSGDLQSGATVHLINEEYDEGPIICQKNIDLSPGETLETLKHKVQEIEGELYIEAIKQVMIANKIENDL